MSRSMPFPWPPRRGVVATLLACGAIGLFAAWRLECVTLGPDPDTDAYGHYVIARQLLETPGNLRIHWVWLPGYHALLALFVRAGLSLDSVRVFNALLAAVPPLLLLWGLRASDGAGCRRSFCALAAVLAAGAPIAMSMGTTGQMEVWFSVLVLGSALLLARQRTLLAALVLSLAVLTRYEAWAAAAGIGVALLIGAARARALPRAAHLACVLCPLLAVLAWAGARWLQGEPWFGFLLDNQSFAERALRPTEPDARWLASAVARYPLTMPALSFGPPAALALFGVARTARREGVWFVLIPLSILVFLVSGALARSHLGLERHFLPLVPFFAIWIAHGIAGASEWLSRTYGRLGPRLVGAMSFSLLGLGAIGVQQAVLGGRWEAWKNTTRHALPAERAAGRFVASLPSASLVVCDEASVEVLSGIEPERVLRSRVRPELMPELLRRAETRDVFVVSKSDRTDSVAALGSIVYRSETGTALAALHVAAPPRKVGGPLPLADHSIAAGPDRPASR